MLFSKTFLSIFIEGNKSWLTIVSPCMKRANCEDLFTRAVKFYFCILKDLYFSLGELGRAEKRYWGKGVF